MLKFIENKRASIVPSQKNSNRSVELRKVTTPRHLPSRTPLERKPALAVGSGLDRMVRGSRPLVGLVESMDLEGRVQDLLPALRFTADASIAGRVPPLSPLLIEGDGLHQLPSNKRSVSFMRLFWMLVWTDFSHFCVLLNLRKVKSRLRVSFSCLLTRLSDGSDHNSLRRVSIKVKLADFPFFFLRLVNFQHLPILEEPFGKLLSIKECSLAIRLINKPSPLIEGTIVPEHLPNSMPQIGMVMSFIDISIVPGIDAVAFLSILQKLAFIFLAGVSLVPHPVSMLQTGFELSFVVTLVLPVVFSKTIEFAICVESLVEISSCKPFSPFPILYKVSESALISACLDLSEDPKASGCSFHPLSNVGIALAVDPHATAIFEVILPLSFIGLAGRPGVFALAMYFILKVRPFVDTPIGKDLLPLSLSLIPAPLAIISLATLIEHDPLAVSFLLPILSIVDCLLVLLEFDVVCLVEYRHIDDVRGEG